MAVFTTNDAVLPFPLRQALDRVDAHLDLLIDEAFPLPKASSKLDTFRCGAGTRACRAETYLDTFSRL